MTDHLDRAREELAVGETASATASALIAIAELLKLSAPTSVTIRTCTECSEVSFGPPDADPGNPFDAWACLHCGLGAGVDHGACFAKIGPHQ